MLFEHYDHIARSMCPEYKSLLNVGCLGRAGYKHTEAHRPGIYTFVCFMHIIDNVIMIEHDDQCL